MRHQNTIEPTNWLEIATKVAQMHNAVLPNTADPILCRRIYRLHKMIVSINNTIEKRGYSIPVLTRRRKEHQEELNSLLKTNKN